ncbi:MAG: hypothetical protein HQM08_16390 [Candidatus Riflebacteria bacterium]|nr:hypothetical protein [Candidatus Riflebacteria bacterium]
MFRFYGFIVAVVLFFSLFCGIQSVSADVTPNKIDFINQKLTIWGYGGSPWEEVSSLEEERARAWTDALHHAYDEILSLQFMDGLAIRQLLYRYPSLKDSLRRTLLGATKTIFEKDLSGLIRCRVEIPFSGKNGIRASLFLAALFPAKIEPKAFIVPISTETREINAASGTPYSRIVLDVRDFNFQPSLFPRFFDVNGNLIFQEGVIPGPERFSRPVVLFSQKIASASQGLSEKEIFYASCKIVSNHMCDLTILPPDEIPFRQFTKTVEAKPLEKLEILIIYSEKNETYGSLPKTKEKEQEGKKRTPGSKEAKP